MKAKKLYHFLMEHETGIEKRKNGTVEAWVHVLFCELDELVEIIEMEDYYEGGITATLGFSGKNGICVTLTDICEFEEEIEDFKDCFNKQDWENAFRSDDQ